MTKLSSTYLSRMMIAKLLKISFKNFLDNKHRKNFNMFKLEIIVELILKQKDWNLWIILQDKNLSEGLDTLIDQFSVKNLLLLFFTNFNLNKILNG